MSTTPLPYGLQWDHHLFGNTTPSFAVQPNIDIIDQLARRHLALDPFEKCDVSFLAEGGLNKVYKVETDIGLYVFRVALPLELPYKVESEVATMDFLRQHTTAPIPRVHAYDSSNENELRFPWIMMDFVVGQSLNAARWKALSMDKKTLLVRQIAMFHAQLQDFKFDGIGSLHHSPGPASGAADSSSPSVDTVDLSAPKLSLVGIFLLCFCLPLMILWHLLRFFLPRQFQQPTLVSAASGIPHLGRLVTMDPFVAEGTRGPFHSTLDWLSARLREAQKRQERVLQDATDDAEIEDAQDVLSFTARVLKLVDNTFPRPLVGPEPMVMLLHDIHEGNVLLDEQGHLVGLIDFEFISTAPLWEACKPPKLLVPSQFRFQPPRKRHYPTYDECSAEEKLEGVGPVYWEHLRDWEKMSLSNVFIEEMERLRPGWERNYREGRTKREFMKLVDSAELSDVFDRKELLWLDLFEKGEPTEDVFVPKIKSWLLNTEMYNTSADDEEMERADEVEAGTDPASERTLVYNELDNSMADTTLVDDVEDMVGKETRRSKSG